MKARDRAAMVRRLDARFADADFSHVRNDAIRFVAREVDRAVRAERKRLTDDEASRISERERIDQQLIEDMRAIGTARSMRART